MLGYAMVMTAATLWAVNGAVSKVILTTGLSSLRLAQVRSTGAFVLIALALAPCNSPVPPSSSLRFFSLRALVDSGYVAID